jgi:two-component system LytT family response regulator
MIRVILVDNDMDFSGTLQKTIFEENKQVDVKNLLQNIVLPYENQRIGLTDNDGTHFFDVRDIIYCINDNSYTHFYIKTDNQATPVKRLTVSKGLGHWEDFLFEKGYFFRVHNRYMININYIKRLNKGDGAYLEILNVPGTISIARDKKNDFIKFLRSKKIVL